jgi:hypothetical protein
MEATDWLANQTQMVNSKRKEKKGMNMVGPRGKLRPYRKKQKEKSGEDGQKNVDL